MLFSSVFFPHLHTLTSPFLPSPNINQPSKYLYFFTVPISRTHITISLEDTTHGLKTLHSIIGINQELHILLHTSHCWKKFQEVKRDLLDCNIMTHPKIPPWQNSHVIGTVACIITTSICLQVHSNNELSQNCTL